MYVGPLLPGSCAHLLAACRSRPDDLGDPSQRSSPGIVFNSSMRVESKARLGYGRCGPRRTPWESQVVHVPGAAAGGDLTFQTDHGFPPLLFLSITPDAPLAHWPCPRPHTLVDFVDQLSCGLKDPQHLLVVVAWLQVQSQARFSPGSR